MNVVRSSFLEKQGNDALAEVPGGGNDAMSLNTLRHLRAPMNVSQSKRIYIFTRAPLIKCFYHRSFAQM